MIGAIQCNGRIYWNYTYNLTAHEAIQQTIYYPITLISIFSYTSTSSTLTIYRSIESFHHTGITSSASDVRATVTLSGCHITYSATSSLRMVTPTGCT